MAKVNLVLIYWILYVQMSMSFENKLKGKLILFDLIVNLTLFEKVSKGTQ